MVKKYSLFEGTPNNSYAYMFDFEKEFEHSDTRDWMLSNWQVCFYYVGVYMLCIFGGQLYMQNRPRFELRKALMCWNLFLAVFSIIGSMRTLPELVHVLKNYGFYHSICLCSFIEDDKVSGFWTWMFALSKVPELGDTVFIVLRKQPLIFLHWYHHITVLIYTWYSYAHYTSTGRWYIVMNYFVHACMYSYYFLRAARIKVPKNISMTITGLQLSQMIVGCYINVSAYMIKQQDDKCRVTERNIKLSLLMYFSYFVLFAHFFYRAYFSKNAKFSESGKKDSTSCRNGVGNGLAYADKKRLKAD